MSSFHRYQLFECAIKNNKYIVHVVFVDFCPLAYYIEIKTFENSNLTVSNHTVMTNR